MILRNHEIDDIEQAKTAEIRSILRDEIENWIRWALPRNYLPPSFRCPIGFMYVIPAGNVYEHDDRTPQPCDELAAHRLEKIIVRLPERHRQAIVMHELDKASIQGKIKIIRGRHDKARLLGVQACMYHRIISQAYKMILRDWLKKS